MGMVLKSFPCAMLRKCCCDSVVEHEKKGLRNSYLNGGVADW